MARSDFLKPRKIVFVFAGDRNQFADFIKRQIGLPGYGNKIEYSSPELTFDYLFVYVTSVEDTYGYSFRNARIEKVGTWYTHDWMNDVIEDIEHRIAIEGK